jgi:hypothetical protein
MKEGESIFSRRGTETPQKNLFSRFYAGSAAIVLNTLILLVLVNLLLGVAFWTCDRYRNGGFNWTSKPRANAFFYKDGTPIDNGKRTGYQLDSFDFTACEGIRPEEAAAVLDDFFGFMQEWFIYQPWVQFTDIFFRSQHLNVLQDDAGFPRRRTENPDNPNRLPEIVVWALGGSTTFGYFVSDQQTWPSYFSQELNDRARQEHLGMHIRVDNYGRSAYTPDQEVILLWGLLRSGQRPSLVIFMDGVNMGGQHDYPPHTPQLAELFRLVQQNRVNHWLWAESLGTIPLGRLATFLWKKLGTRAGMPAPALSEDQLVRWKCNRFKESWQLAGELCRCYGVDLLVCLQPTPFYHYNPDLWRFPKNDFNLARKRQTEGLYDTLRREKGVLYLGDLYRAWGPRRKACIDDVHYTSGFNKFLAENLASHLDLRKLPVSPGYLPQEAAGATRPKDLSKAAMSP